MDFVASYAVFAGEDTTDNALQAAAKIKNDFSGVDPEWMLFTFGVDYNPEVLASAMAEMFPHTKMLGCRSTNQITSGQVLTGAVSALAAKNGALASAHTVIANNIDVDPHAVDKAFAKLEKRLGAKAADFDYRRYTGFIFLDCFAYSKEAVIERVGTLTDVFFAGGCGSDGIHYKRSTIIHNGVAYDNAAGFTIIEPKRGWKTVKTQSLTMTDQKLVATRVDPERNLVLELNGHPAANYYADLVGVPVDMLSMRLFNLWPLTVTIDGEPFIKSAYAATPTGALIFYTKVYEGMRFTLARSGDIVDDTAAVIINSRKELGSISAAAVANCTFCHGILEAEERVKDYGALFKDIPTVGLTSLGEIYISMINQSSSILLLG